MISRSLDLQLIVSLVLGILVFVVVVLNNSGEQGVLTKFLTSLIAGVVVFALTYYLWGRFINRQDRL